jgi:hypothetical protein
MEDIVTTNLIESSQCGICIKTDIDQRCFIKAGFLHYKFIHTTETHCICLRWAAGIQERRKNWSMFTIRYSIKIQNSAELEIFSAYGK